MAEQGPESIWWGLPQWQIEAFRRLHMPEEYLQRFGFNATDRRGETTHFQPQWGRDLRDRSCGI
ncbi:MAG TPA: hypothetical protein VF846_16805 [Thermoanaerobaculia bacterium]